MSSEGSSLGGVNDLHANHHHNNSSSNNHNHHAGASAGFHPPPASYLSSGYGSYMTGMSTMSAEGSGGMGPAELGISSFSIRNPLKRPGEDLDSLASSARQSPRDREQERERERERERQREHTSMSLVSAGRDADEQAQALRRPASFPVLGAPGATAYMGTPVMGHGAAPATPSNSGFLPSSTGDARFRGYGHPQGTPSSVGPAPPMSTPFNFTPRSTYDDSMGGPNSLMNTPGSHHHPYGHSHSHSYSQSNHGGMAATSTPPPPMGVPTGVPDFMRSSSAHMGFDHSHGHLPQYPQHGFEHDPYHPNRGSAATPVQFQGPIPQPIPSIPDGAPRASLEIEGDLERQVFGWDHEEWTNGRRLLQFWRRQEGTTIHASFKNVLQREYDQPEGPRGIIISCIFRPDKNECFITSVDLIYLLESLINNRFTVEEKNRIRRNLEGFRPMTISKNKPDCSGFFKRIMGFPAPKPRNIEKDVKVFAWATLRPALCKIVGKYYASYTPGTASGPASLAMGQDLGQAAQIGGPGSGSPAGVSTLSMSGSTSMPLGVVGVTSRTPSLEQQIHRVGSAASMRSSGLHGSPAGGNGNSNLSSGHHGLGSSVSALNSLTAGSAPTGGFTHTHPLALQGGPTSYGGNVGSDYHAPHSAASTPTQGAGHAGTGAAFSYSDYMQSGFGNGPHAGHGSGLNSLNVTSAMGVGTPSNGQVGHRIASGTSSNHTSSTAGSVGLGLGPSPMPPPSSSSQPSVGSNYVYSPTGTGASGAGGAVVNGGIGTYQQSLLIPGGTGQSNSSGTAASGNGSNASPAPAHSTASSNHGLSAPTIGASSGDVSSDFASGILPAPLPGRARGLSATLAGASSSGFRRT
ncbi:unnamed protein product [Tilletia controversa]|uniref:DUF7082 domain-containing protein n=3 Tax=Tilletia TaxID=13289 RepID=A0A8X7MX52_9BASI|nr:hypothetical protein CF336_g1643 [Tilletia laevis]KAE8202540.1 hypothetical protein CF328_g2155 [Tilletia controversa]KAE8255492.1 hypothetical protein A4X03_0g5555 [Tilletia caries]KAE8206869.1 hypothetical protein CF335_g1552 [Tilletia laevis]KAE8251469.1 hypothetical protein A4X06_0g2671 [Tilletia controversa]